MKVAVVTAIVGGYEKTCKRVASQKDEADFFVYTDNPDIETHGVWKVIDIEPYRYGLEESDIDPNLRNSLCNNTHSFNRAKFIKLNLTRLPELSEYDILIWLDGSISVLNVNFITYCKYQIELGNHNFLVFDHFERNGYLIREVIASHFERYTSTLWNGQRQPFQYPNEQYVDYIKMGFEEGYYERQGIKSSANYGVWITCFLAVDRTKKETQLFFRDWWLHSMKYTTQDQIAFPFLIWKYNIRPLSLPQLDDQHIQGNAYCNNLFLRFDHGI